MTVTISVEEVEGDKIFRKDLRFDFGELQDHVLSGPVVLWDTVCELRREVELAAKEGKP